MIDALKLFISPGKAKGLSGGATSGVDVRYWTWLAFVCVWSRPAFARVDSGVAVRLPRSNEAAGVVCQVPSVLARSMGEEGVNSG